MKYPTISIILPRKADGSAETAIQAILSSDYPQHLLEILEVVGESPSRQRNTAAQAAKGEILYFLDNDSLVTPTLFSRVIKYYAESFGMQHASRPKGDHSPSQEHNDFPGLAGVGGPNLTPSTDNFLQKTFGYALASPFAHFSMCARYKPTGEMRYAGEKELILCNLSVRREIFLQEGGFDESMYPNEENEFINRLVEKGYRFLYDPDAYVYRSRRHQFLDFMKQLSHYGRGRADQIVVEGLSLRSLIFFMPFGLLVYLLLLAGFSVAGISAWWQYPPFLLYAALGMHSAFQYAIHERNPALALILPLSFLGMHLSHGVGLIFGFFKAWLPENAEDNREPAPVEVIVRKALEA
jgi:GT2 family glycosyltransferase